MLACSALPVVAQDQSGGGQTQIIDAHSHNSSQPLNVQSGQTVVIDFGSSGSLALPGNFSNSGTVYLVSSSANHTTGTLSATNITNLPGAVLTSVLPAGGIAGLPNLLPSFSFTLNAINSIVNQGTIASSGNLSMIAGGSIVNQANAVMSAIQNLNLSSYAGIANSGNISALIGNINIDTANLHNTALISALAGNLNLTNSLRPELGLSVVQEIAGSMQALPGTITAQTLDQALKQPITIAGGSLLAQETVLNAGEGSLKLEINDLRGPLSVHAGTASLSVNNGTNGFTLKELTVTGDPNLIYTGVGPFFAAGFNSLGGQVNIDTSSDLISGSITFTGPILTAPVGAGNGGDVTLKAGTTITTNLINTTGQAGSSGGNVDIRANGSITTGQVLSMGSQAGAPGGNVSIVSTGGNITTLDISTSSTVANGRAGNIYLVGGTVTTNNVSAESPVIGAGSLGGNVVIFAKGDLSTGNVSSAARIPANILLTAGTSGTGSLTAGNLTAFGLTGAASITLVSPNNITIGSASVGSTAGQQGQLVAIAGGGASNATLSTGTLTGAGSGASIGSHMILINLSGSVSTTDIITSTTGAATTGGDISITARDTISTGNLTLNAPGVGSFGGDVWLSAGAAAGTAVSTGTINTTGGAGRGQIFVLNKAGATTNLGSITGGAKAADFFGTPASPVASISGNTMLSITSGAVSGFQPGGFVSINAPSGTITLNQTVRVPAPIVAQTGGITLAGVIGVGLPQNQTVNLAAGGDINIVSVPSIPGGIIRIASTNGQVTLPAMNNSGNAPISGAVAVVGAKGITLPNGVSIDNRSNTAIGGPVLLASPNGSITLGSTGNVSGNQITTKGALLGGPIVAFAGGSFLNNNVMLNSGNTPNVLIGFGALAAPPVPAPPQRLSSLPASLASPDASFPPIVLAPPAVAGNGTILPTDTLPISIPVGARDGSNSLPQSLQGDERLAIIDESKFTPGVLSRLTNQGIECSLLSTDETLSMHGGAGIFAPDKNIVIEVNGTRISIRAGSIVLISASSTDLAVYDLHDNSTGDVVVGNVQLWPGEMVAISTLHRAPHGMGILDRIARRASSQANLPTGSGFVSDFSILSAVAEMQDLRPLLKTGQTHRHIATAILKNAAIQLHMGKGRETFKASAN